jgi:hypothetical protein
MKLTAKTVGLAALFCFIGFTALIIIGLVLPPPPSRPPEEHWLTEGQAVGALAVSDLGDGVWATSSYGMEMVALQVNPSVYGSRWIVRSRQNSGPWSDGTPHATASNAINAIMSGAGTRQFKKFIAGQVIR